MEKLITKEKKGQMLISINVLLIRKLIKIPIIPPINVERII